MMAVASRLKRLSEQFMRGGGEVYSALNVDFESRWFAVFYLLYTSPGPLSISEITHSLGLTHPAVIQTTHLLAKKGLVVSSDDKKDRRVRKVALTEKGGTSPFRCNRSGRASKSPPCAFSIRFTSISWTRLRRSRMRSRKRTWWNGS